MSDMNDKAQQINLEGNPDWVTITKVEYDSLKHMQNFLNCLEACGVDNWMGWDDAHAMMRGEEV